MGLIFGELFGVLLHFWKYKRFLSSSYATF